MAILTFTWPPISVSASSPSNGTPGAPIPAQATLVAGEDGSGNLQPLHTDTSGDLQVDVLTSALPTGAATSANQDTGNASLASIDSKLTSPLTVTGPLTDTQLRAVAVPVSGTVAVSNFPTTQPVSAASLPLPTGAATSALQISMSAKTAASLVPDAHDYISTTYVGATTRIDTVVYKLGGAAGTTVATLTMGYDGSDRLTSVTRS